MLVFGVGGWSSGLVGVVGCWDVVSHLVGVGVGGAAEVGDRERHLGDE